ncbi:MAG: hypothetical protein LM517_04110 [Nitrosomonas sp.]|nr:hypothetical protein [Nitrosomonas sp.]
MKNILFVVIVVAGYFWSSISYAADPCSDDPSCIKAENAHFDNPNHYVFVAAYPGDELLIYPLMKDHCSEAGNYCAMVIATQGKSGCESTSDNNCGKLRTLELENSSKYLNADVWHYDLPDSNAMVPNTLEQTRLTYQQIAQSIGLNHLSNYFEYIFNKIRLSNGNPLVVMSLNPYRNAISHSDDYVMRVLDESIENAVETLQKSGTVISHLYVASRVINHPDAISKDNNPFMLCRKGNEQLRATHTAFTNFEVFKHGFYDIYPSQIFHTGNIENDPTRYEFCLDRAQKYFSTNQSEKFFGFGLTESSQLIEIKDLSNAFAFYPKDLAEVTDYLNKNTEKLIPVIEIGRFLFNSSTGIFENLDIVPLIHTIKNTSYQGPVLFLVDEPLWRIRLACFKQNAVACNEIDNNYASTLDLFRKIGRELRKALPETGLIHIEAFAELILQKRKNPSANVVMFDNAEYLGYDCYGSFDSCGIADVSSTFLSADTANLANFSIVSNFSNSYPVNLTPYKITDSDIIKFLIGQLPDFSFPSLFKGLDSFFDMNKELILVCDSSNNECIITNQAENISSSSMSQNIYIDWVRNALSSMEASNPIGRKIFLIPGAFQDFHMFPTENLAIDQINAFTQVLDSSPLFGGMGVFIWGDIQEGSLPFIGARSLQKVRLTLADIFLERMNSKRTPNRALNLKPAMSLVGAVGLRGSFEQIEMLGQTTGDIYFQSAGMDVCTLTIENHLQQTLKLDELNYISIPNLTPPIQAEAICFKDQQKFDRKILFVN